MTICARSPGARSLRRTSAPGPRDGAGAVALQEFGEIDSAAAAKRNLRAGDRARGCARLGNTATICRKCYVHPEIIDSYLSGDLIKNVKRAIDAELSEKLRGPEARRKPRCSPCFPTAGSSRKSARSKAA